VKFLKYTDLTFGIASIITLKKTASGNSYKYLRTIQQSDQKF
jgi:hypothetical protein